MKIVILDGQLDATPKSYRIYLNNLKNELENQGHSLTHHVLKDLGLHHCIGCWDCWVKTPGQCVFDDASREINREIINADFLLFASPLVMGFVTHELKRKMDRIIPLIHPYITMVENESHHRSRYDKYPILGLLMYPATGDNDDDVYITSQMFARTALNFKSRLAFAVTTDESPAHVANLFANLDQHHYVFNRNIPQAKRAPVSALNQMVVFNGSPRGKKGNTPVLLDQFTRGFQSVPDRSVEIYHLSKTRDIPRFVEAYQNAESVLLGFPLYTDAMPGIVKEFIDALQPLVRRKNNPPMAFLVQSGFGENHHSRYVQRYLESLAARMGSPYLGTLVRGGCEGVRMMPEQMNRKTFDALRTLGVQLAQKGEFTQAAIGAFGNHENIPRYMLPVYWVMTRLPLINWYWNSQLKENGAFVERFAQPYR
jgi:multimeric flavodoxin WrbA